MELKILSSKEDSLLSRTKIEAEVIFDKSTPSNQEVKSKLSKDLGKEEKLIVIKGIYTIRGLKKAKNLSYVYKNEEALKRIEIVKKEVDKKGAEVEDKPQEAEKKEQKEVKKEEKSEENKSEDKPKEQKKENTSKDKK